MASLGLLPWLNKATFPDEGVSLRSAHLGWTALWHNSRVVDLVLLPYYSILHVWLQVTGGIEWARVLSLLAFGLTVLLVGRLAARLGGSSCGVLAAVLAATCPLLVTAALSARPYALSALVATVSVMVLMRWLAGGWAGWLWLFCLAAIATLLLQMFAILVPVFALVVAIAFRPGMFRERWRSLIAPLVLVLAATLSFAIFTIGQRRQIAWIPSLFEGKQLITALTGPASGGHFLYALVVAGVAVVAIALCLRAWGSGGFRPSRVDWELLTLFVAWGALPTATLAVISLVKPVFVDRYVTSSVPGMAMAIALLAARAFDVTTARWADRSRVIFGSAVLATATVAVWLTCSVPAAQAVFQSRR